MRNLAICGPEAARRRAGNPSIRELAVNGVPVTCGIVETAEPHFDPDAAENARRVLVRVRAFSCNYRDKGQIFKMAQKGPAGSFYVIGSEFVGDVLAVGGEVTRVAVGDRVVGDNSFPYVWPTEWQVGIPTNSASREVQAFHEAKVVAIPAGMPDEVAAAFSLGAQTVYSMVRKLEVGPGSRVLVTAARSNTSLFAIAALRARGAEVYATTTSDTDGDTLRAMGVREVFRVNVGMTSFKDHPGIQALVKDTGGFDAAVDPFFDLHIRKVLPTLRFGGRYTTCGLFDQYFGERGGGGVANPGEECAIALQVAMLKNIQIHGNCLGQTADLEHALSDYAAGTFRVPVDSVFRGDDAAPFLDRTYCSTERLGKVVFSYT
ncbi:MAG: Alcohol dehydrogenase GroES domain protein [Gemmatimonadetes bacterium]|nr:Alcohol dehydrogenase GroES domain protein [Gemmatimonadota bacterium]